MEHLILRSDEFDRIYPREQLIFESPNSKVYISGDFVVKQYNKRLDIYSQELTAYSRFRHPNLMNMICTCTDLQAFVLEKGTSILDYVKRNKDEVVPIFYQLLCALEFVHANNYALVDIKPENIVVVDGVPKFIDFGTIAPCFNTTSGKMFQFSLRLHTIGFEPPEMECYMQGDVFALGKTFECILLGLRQKVSNIVTERFNGFERDDLLVDLISKMLKPVESRQTPTQLLNHPIFANMSKSDGVVIPPCNEVITRTISEFAPSLITFWERNIESVTTYLADYKANNESLIMVFTNLFQLSDIIKNSTVEGLEFIMSSIMEILAPCGQVGHLANSMEKDLYYQMVVRLNGIFIHSDAYFRFCQNRDHVGIIIRYLTKVSETTYDPNKCPVGEYLDTRSANSIVNLPPNLSNYKHTSTKFSHEVFHKPTVPEYCNFTGHHSIATFKNAVGAHLLTYSIAYHNRHHFRKNRELYKLLKSYCIAEGFNYPPLLAAIFS